jgi:thiopurine S-methyltransferase
VAHLQSILLASVQGLLITLDYDQAQMPGPPFAVEDVEVQRLMADTWQAQKLEEQDVLGESWKFVQAGVTRLEERVYRISTR